MIKRYMIIDDDKWNNLLCTHIIKAVVTDADVVTYTEPEVALDDMNSKLGERTVVLLDINMPTLTGWEVLDRIAAMPSHVRGFLHVYMLSSSITQLDQERAGGNALVRGYIEKPLHPLKVPLVQ